MIAPLQLQKIAISTLKGVGKVTLEKLCRANIYHYQDLLLHLPLRYEDRTQFTALNALLPDSFAYIQGKIIAHRFAYSSQKKKMLLCNISDGQSSITLRFMHANSAMAKSLLSGAMIAAFGQVKRGKEGLELIHPQYQLQRAGKLHIRDAF